MKKNLIIAGAGGLGREVLWQLNDNHQESDKYNFLGFADDAKALCGSEINGAHVIGNIEDLQKMKEDIYVLVAVGNPLIRKKIDNKLRKNSHIKFPSLISNYVKMSEYVKYGEGCIFCLSSIITVNIEIGDFFISNWNCTVGHDCRIGDYVTLYPNVNVSGNVEIGELTEIGTGTQIIQGRKIGRECVIGAGAVVNKEIPSYTTAVGVPAKVKKQNRHCNLAEPFDGTLHP